MALNTSNSSNLEQLALKGLRPNQRNSVFALLNTEGLKSSSWCERLYEFLHTILDKDGTFSCGNQ